MEQGKREIRLVRDIADSLGKLPPSAIAIEEAVLGAIMLFSADLNDVAGILRPEHFYMEANKEVYQAIQDIYAAGDPVGMRTVVERLRKNGKIELVGGISYIADLGDKVSQSGSAEYNTRLLQEYYLKRQFILMASRIHQKAYDDTTDVFELIDWTNKSIQDALDQNTGGHGEKHIKEFAFQALKDMEGRMSGHLTGVRSGYESVDRILNGHQNGDFVVIGGRPGMAKSIFLFQECIQVAKEVGPVGIFSLEMPGLQLMVRAASSEAEIDNDRAMKGRLDEYEFRLYMETLGKLSLLPIYIDDGAALNILEIRSRARRMKIKHNVVLIAIDYLQLIKAISEQRNLNRDQEIGIITRTIKAIAKELNIPIVVISSLSRDVEKRGGTKRPQLSDVRESGSIESDADVVMFLYRPEYYGITEDEHGHPTHGMCEIIIAKHRNGALGTALLKFIGKYTKFKPWIEEVRQPDYSGVKNPGTPERDTQLNIDSPF